MLGKALGVKWQGHGPLDKVEKLVWRIIIAFVQWKFSAAVNPAVHIMNYNLSILDCGMILFFVLGQITVLRRFLGIRKDVMENPDRNGNYVIQTTPFT